MKNDREIKRGDVYYIFPDDNTTGSEQRSGRPGLVVSNNRNNRNSSVMEVVHITKQYKKDLPTHVKICLSGVNSTGLCEQVDSVSVKRIGNYMGHVDYRDLTQINKALSISLGL